MINFDQYTIKEIDELITKKVCNESHVIEFYNNQWWRYDGK